MTHVLTSFDKTSSDKTSSDTTTLSAVEPANSSSIASTSEIILSVEDLTVSFGEHHVVEDLSFIVKAGKTTAIVGESGSGKSMTSLSIMRLIGHLNGRISAGKMLYHSQNGVIDLAQTTESAMRKIRGKEIAMIFQEPMTSLNPVFTIGDQLTETLLLHENITANQAYSRAKELLQLVRLPDVDQLIKRYPHQLSGGMRQRVMIAMSLACSPKMMIADEPTTALDVTIQAQILSIMKSLQNELGMGMIFITHDMGVVAEIADDVVVMRQGKHVETADVKTLFAHPKQTYTQHLLSAVPKLGSMRGIELPQKVVQASYFDADALANRLAVSASSSKAIQSQNSQSAQSSETVIPETLVSPKVDYDAQPVVSVKDLISHFDVKQNWYGKTTHRVHAVEKVSFDIFPGETLSLVGESGSGKTCIGRTIQQLLKPTSGEIIYQGKPLSSMLNNEKQQLRQTVQYIFQDPFSSLDPRKTIGFSIAEPILTHGLLPNGKAVEARVAELLEKVGLNASHAKRYPHQFSGGQRQRICIARALASEPKLIIADEALSALDVSIQAQIIELFMKLQIEEGISYLFISHDMAVVEQMSHRVAVLYLGQIVEMGSRQAIFENPLHPYTKRLLSAVPVADPTSRVERTLATEDIPSRIYPADYQPIHANLIEVEPNHFVAESIILD